MELKCLRASSSEVTDGYCGQREREHKVLFTGTIKVTATEDI